MYSPLEFDADFGRHLETAVAQYDPRRVKVDGFRDAAVIVPLFLEAGEWKVMFTVRSARLSNHAGQISFPGGKVDGNETLEQAAIRELHEETGLSVDGTLGRLSSLPSPAQFVVTPWVAILEWPQTLKVNPAEVDEVFSVPLAQLAAIQPRIESRSINGVDHPIRYYHWHQYVIWGLTGNIVDELLTLVRGFGRPSNSLGES